MNVSKRHSGLVSALRAFHQDSGGMEALQAVAILALAAVTLFAVNRSAANSSRRRH